MSTISELVVAASVDPSGVKRGLDQALGFTKQFASSVDQQFKGLGNPASGTAAGQEWAQALIDGATSSFDSAKATMREQLFRGALSPQQFAEEGKQAAVAFNETLLEGLGELRMDGVVNRGQEEQIVAQLKSEGMQAGRSYTQGMALGIEEGGSAVMGAGEGVAERLQHASINIAFAVEELFNGSESGVERVGHSLALLGFAFGPVVGAATLATTALGLGLFHAMRADEEQATKTAAAIRDMTNSLQESGSLDSVSKRMQQLFSGDQFVATSDPLHDLIASGGLQSLQRQRDNIKAQIAALGNPGAKAGTADFDVNAMQAFSAENTRLTAELTAVEAKIKTVNEAYQPLLDVFKRLAQAEGDRVKVTAELDAQGHPYATMATDVDTLLTAYKQLHEAGQPIADVYKALNTEWNIAGQLLDQQPDKLGKSAAALRKMREDIQAVITPVGALSIGGLPNVGLLPTLTAPAQGGEDAAAQELIARSQLLRARFGEFSQETQSSTRDLAALQDVLTQRIAAQGGPLTANLDLLRAQAAVMKELAAIAPTITPKPLGSLLPSDALTTNAVDARNAANAARAVGASNAGQLSAEADAARKRALASIKAEIEATSQANLTDAERSTILAQLARDYDALTGASKGATAAVDGILSGVRGLIDTTAQMGKLDQQTREALDSMVSLVQAIMAAAEAKKAMSAAGGGGTMATLGMIGAGLGVAGAVVGLLGSIFGKSPLQQEHDAALRANTDKITALTATLQGGVGGVGGMMEAGKQAADLLATFKILKYGTGPIGIDLSKFYAATQAKTGDKGMTYEQFLAAVKASGVQLFDSKGNLMPGALDQFTKYVNEAAQAAARLTSSFADQQTLTGFMERVFGRTSDQDKLQDTVKLISSMSPAIGAMLSGIDTTTAAGRAQLEQAFQAIATMIANNALTPEMLGTFTDVQELISAILGAQDSLDGLAGAANQLTDAFYNVPTGYKTALAIFQATAPVETATDRGGMFGLGRNPLTDRRGTGISPLGAPGAGSVTAGARGGGATVYQFGDVYVDAHERSPDELFQAVLKVAKRKAYTTFNDSTRWSEVQQ
jgi:hypothetical protein